MTTDITELAQSLKAAADREMICRDVAETSEIWERTVTPENILALVEALEKAQAQSSKWLEAYHKAVSIGARYEERIAELESRAVTAGNLQESAYRAGLTAGWNLGLANNNDGFNKCLAAHTAGIKVEAE
ncbi:hypothetical protein QMO30_09975 [Klebsiella pneumoniae]|uniref:hypothetical protein n=1 Tax=Klebsiella pneumoniae TaxID=573 RepID=UPI0024AECDE7|nr:hypothetical protein [Klebsiella pneumoniae]MDI6995243.1 hypothetical protein [Klebsiella pneumoniae]